MDEATRAALEASIEHWRENVKAETPDQVSLDSADCALCRKFFVGEDGINCIGCPVSVKTMNTVCTSSPYYDTVEAFEDWTYEIYEDSSEARDAFRAAAQAELDFLISLRPKEGGDQ